MYYISIKLWGKAKRQETDWEKIFAKHIFNQGLLLRIDKREKCGFFSYDKLYKVNWHFSC